MGYIYEPMDQGKEQIRAAYEDRWNNQLHCPIHATRYFLNPKYHYKNRLGDLHDGKVRAGLIDCLERMVPTQLTVFTMAGSTFSKNFAKMTRDVDQPSCERNWSIFERIRTKKRNRLEQKRLNDLVFVQYNLRLRRNQMMSKTPDLDPIVLDDIDPTSKWVEETKDHVFEADFDFDIALAGDEANYVATSEPGSVAASRKGKEPMEGTSHVDRQTRASIRSTFIVIGGIDTKVADQVEASSDSKPDDVYVAPDDDPVASSSDELDD
eukprot:PITA_36450